MKCSWAALAILAAASVTLALAEDFKTTNGKEYKNATISRVEPDGLVIKFSGGIVKIPFPDLPKEVRERFYYNPQKAAEFNAQERAAVAQFNTQIQGAATPQQRATNAVGTQDEVEQKAKAIIEQSQNKPSIGGFLNVAWGTSREEAKKIMSQRDGVVFKGSNKNQSQLYFIGGTFSDFDVQLITLSFLGDRFYDGFVRVKQNATVKRIWYDLCAGLAKKYGPIDSQDENSLSAIWWIPNFEKANETIHCFVPENYEGVAVVYTNLPMHDEAEKAHEEGISSKDM